MAQYRALTAFSYLADEAEHLAAVSGHLAYEAGHRTHVAEGAVVDNLPSWVVDALNKRGRIAPVGGESTAVAPAPVSEPEPVAPPASEPQPATQPEPAPAEQATPEVMA